MSESKDNEALPEENGTAVERRRESSERRDVVDRRVGMDRRASDTRGETSDASCPEPGLDGRTERRSQTDRRGGLDRRRGPGRRRTDDRRSAEEGEMTEEQFEFLMAIEEYKKVNKRPFPTWTEVLDVIRALGYRKVAEHQKIR